MLSAEMARNFNIVNSQFRQIVKEHNEMAEKLNNQFKETIQNFRDFGILDVERDVERNNDFYRLITRNPEIRGNLYMNGDIHLKGKIIKETEEQKEIETQGKIDEALINSLSTEVQSQIANLKEKIDSIQIDEKLVNSVVQEIPLSNEKIRDDIKTIQKALSSFNENQAEKNGIHQDYISQLQNRIQLLENKNSSFTNEPITLNSNILSIVYTPKTVEDLTDNTISLEWEQNDITKPFSIILYDFSFFPNIQLSGKVMADSKKLKLDINYDEPNNRTNIKITKQNGKLCRIEGFIGSENDTYITSTIFH